MTTFRKALENYLELRRGLGFELHRPETRLRHFIVFLEKRKASRITTKLALQFATQSEGRSATTKSGYLSAVRGFARYLQGINPKTEVPPEGLIRKDRRPHPYIYSDDEIERIIRAARNYPSAKRNALKPWTLHCLFGLLTVTGMRLTEALSLTHEDINWSDGILKVGRAKFQKSRLIPVHSSTLCNLEEYAKRKADFFSARPRVHPIPEFFVTTLGTQLTAHQASCDFRDLTRKLGLRCPCAERGPRIHDIRHRFAISSLLRAYRKGKNVELILPVLSTYLGHAWITGTYWYLTCTPELMRAAGKRLEARWKGIDYAAR